MTAQSIFELKNVDLGYAQGEPILRVPELQVKRGQLTFVLGPSGAGKSTLLESLGLMKNTILPGNGSTLRFNGSDESSTDLMNVWNDGGEQATGLRKKYFSFIFQSTNLMPNFTLGENICFTGMLDGKGLGEMKPKALKLMEQLNLDTQLFDQPSTMASGGQRQRAAFVRALCKDFEVLFGDEPTGNLDKGNAISLFTLLKDHVKRENRAAIIVSHDTELADQFADELVQIVLKGSNGTTIGEVQR